MSENRFSVSHTVRVPGFKYDVLKGELIKGSCISKSTHPLVEVEVIKQRLLERKMLKDMGTHWELRSNIRTGILMAVNLHSGQFLRESPYKQDIVVSKAEATELEGKFQEKQVCVTDSDIVMKSLRDTQRFGSVNIMEVNSEVFTHHEGDSFGKDEAFVLSILQKKGVVSTSVRHGSTAQNEADIVDEITGEQFEITYEFKTSLSKKKMKPDILFDPEIQLLQLVDNPFIHTSKALGKKLKKEYSERYRSNLVILTFGNKQAIVSMLEALSKKILEENITRVNFANIYIIALDFITERAIFARISQTEPFESELFPCKNEELGFIRLTQVEPSSMEGNRKYLMICDGIFDGVQRCRYDYGSELRKWIKEIHVWGIPKD